MEFINETSNSKVYRNGDKICKYFKSNRAFYTEIRSYNAIKQHDIRNIINFIKIHEDMKMIEMNYYPYNLEDYFQSCYNFQMNKQQIYKILFELTLSLNELHYNNIVHGDFKAKNIMLDINLNPIIIDFDLSEIETKESDIKKFHYLIYQLLYNVPYTPKLYNNYKKMMITLENDYPFIAEAMKKNNLIELSTLFNDHHLPRDTSRPPQII
tara:strand:- start:313 stop:945 length:633 start_codon:yes stop_codon:yes gene_type:complete